MEELLDWFVFLQTTPLGMFGSSNAGIGAGFVDRAVPVPAMVGLVSIVESVLVIIHIVEMKTSCGSII